MSSFCYKNRNPKDTIEIIHNFFTELNYKIVFTTEKSEIGTWSSNISLLQNDQILFNHYGKGITEELALASGYGELYERFCLGLNYITNPILYNNLIQKKNNKQKEYVFHPEEKQKTIEEILSNPIDKSLQKFYNTYIPNKNLLISYLSLFSNTKNFITLPFNNFINPNKKEWFDLRFCMAQQTSTGASAGNTLEEALNQGLSELLERMGFNLFYTDLQDQYYELDVLNMNEIESSLKEKIKKILDNPIYDIKFIDLGYNFNIPVIFGFLINKKNFRIYQNFSCFADINIAIERILTELYQGINSFNTNLNKSKNTHQFHRPFGNRNINVTIMDAGLERYDKNPFFFENFCEKVKKVNTFSNCFLNNLNKKNNSPEQNNKEVFVFYQKLLKNNKIDCYYYNLSLTKDMYCTYIYMASNNLWKIQLNMINDLISADNRCKQFKQVLQNINNIYNLLENKHELKNSYYDFFDPVLKDYFSTLEGSFNLIPQCNNQKIYLFFDVLKNTKNLFKDLNIIQSRYYNTCLEQLIQKLIIINDYKIIYGENNEIILKCLLSYGFNNITYEDILNYNNIEYIYNKALFDLKENLYSSVYDSYLEILSNLR